MIFFIFYFFNLFIQRIISNQILFQELNSSTFLNQEEKSNLNINSLATPNVNTSVNATKTNALTTNIVTKQNINANSTTSNQAMQSTNKLSYTKSNEWKIVIPSINLDAPISEGTSTDVMNEFVGHFENTAVFTGNVGLAAHNRGYPVNYFANIKDLQVGEIIQYYYHGRTIKYVIQTVTIIDDTDWTYLNNTFDNRITLITCVEDEPEYRRCIQAIEI